MANMMTINVPTRGLDVSKAEAIVSDLFYDAGIEIENMRHAEDDDGPMTKVDIDVTNLDEAIGFVVPHIIDQENARIRYEAIESARGQAPDFSDMVPNVARNTVVVNMYGGPGAGKTTAAFEVMEKLKKAGYVVEYAPEFAKELVWTMGDERAHPSQRALAAALLDGEYKHQLQLYEQQLARIQKLVGQCDFVVTDSPTQLSAMYLKPKDDAQLKRFEQRVVRDASEFESFNMFVKRSGEYEQAGRVHDETEAIVIDGKIENFLERTGQYYGTYNHNQIDVAIRNMVKTYERVNGTVKKAGAEGVKNEKEGSVKDMAEEKSGQEVAGQKEEWPKGYSVTLPSAFIRTKDREGNYLKATKFDTGEPIVSKTGKQLYVAYADIPKGVMVGDEDLGGRSIRFDYAWGDDNLSDRETWRLNKGKVSFELPVDKNGDVYLPPRTDPQT